MSNYNTPNYMSSDWGNHTTRETANHIDHIADKVRFGLRMIKSALDTQDALEREIVDFSNGTVPPTREVMRSWTYRMDAIQNQVKQGMDEVEKMMIEIDRSTNNIQNKTGW
jgi:hypothetical protein